MGVLKGDVEILGLGNLLQLLTLNKREGVLTLSKGNIRKQFHFAPVGIRLLFSPLRLNKLGNILVRKRHLTQADLEALLKEQNLLGWKFGKVATSSGKVSKEAIEDALREQIEEEIFDAFMWIDAAFEFIDLKDAPMDDDTIFRGVTFDTDVTSLVLEASRRTDEMLQLRSVLNDEDMRLQRTEAEASSETLGGDPEACSHVLAMVKTSSTLREIVLGSIYPRYATMRAIYRLISTGHIQAFDREGRPFAIAPSNE